MIRWQVSIYYRTEQGVVDVVHDLPELEDLHDFVERGPHWDAIERIEIYRVNHCTSATLTVEEAEKL